MSEMESKRLPQREEPSDLEYARLYREALAAGSKALARGEVSSSSEVRRSNSLEERR